MILKPNKDPKPDDRWRSYALAAAYCSLAFFVRWLLDPLLEQGAPFLLFVLPVVAAVITGGRGPGILAGILSLIGGLSFVAQPSWSSTSIIGEATVFIGVCAAIGLLGERLALERRASEQARDAAEIESANARVSSEQLRLLLKAATRYAIILIGADGKIATWNSGARRLFGWPGNEVVGQHSSIFYPADGREKERADNDLQHAEREGLHAEEAWQVRADGSEFLADITITPVKDEHGKLRGYAKVVHDATDRRASEAAILRRERQLESILDTVPDAMVVIDTAGSIMSFSRTAEEMFGYSEADVVGKNVKMLMPSPDREQHDGYIHRYLESGEPRIIGKGRVVTGLRADGTSFPMKLSVGEALFEDQRIFTGFVQDLTETRNFEARLEQLRSELIHVSRVSAMGTMASTLAHELNQPLTAIANYGEAAQGLFESEQLDREMLLEIYSEMAAQALRAGSIVRRLREFVARGEVNKTIEDLPKLVNEAGALALVGSREKGIESHFVFDPEATPVIADRVQIQQVLINLMRNAIEAMAQSDKRRLTVETRLVNSETVEISVQDTGPGIDPDLSARLFQAFESTKESGMGLGLSICRTIVEAHNGRIAARPVAPGGTEFYFTLPRATNPG